MAPLFFEVIAVKREFGSREFCVVTSGCRKIYVQQILNEDVV